jgi:ParB family transcriptional regulator, chromosome partitioning protein
MVSRHYTIEPDTEPERRRAPRRRMLKQVEILSLDKKSSSAIDCTLRNISSSGAQLTGAAPSISRIPGQFYLVAPGQLRMIRCKVVWKTYDAVGICFLSDPGQLTSELPDCADDRSSGNGERVALEPQSRLETHGPDRTPGMIDHRAAPVSLAAPDTALEPSDGLAALLRKDELEDTVAPPAECQVSHLPIEQLSPGPNALRVAFDHEELQGLARSIREQGFLQPLIVRRRPDGDSYEIVVGERRWRAAQLTDMREVPVLIGELSDAEAVEIGLVENMQRSDLSPLEEARGYAQLVERHGYSQQQLADAVGKSRSHVANMLRLLSLPDEVKAHLEDRKLSAGHARALVAAEAPVELANQIIERSLNVREAERLANPQQGSRVRRNGRAANDSEFRHLERMVSEGLGLKVDIAGAGQSGARVIVHVQTAEQLNDVCRRLARQD